MTPEELHLKYRQLSPLDYMWEIDYMGVVIEKSEKPTSYDMMVSTWTKTVEASASVN